MALSLSTENQTERDGSSLCRAAEEPPSTVAMAGYFNSPSLFFPNAATTSSHLFHRPAGAFHLRLSRAADTTTTAPIFTIIPASSSRIRRPLFIPFSGGDYIDRGNGNNVSGGGDVGSRGHRGGDDAGDRNRKEVLLVLGKLGRPLENLPEDLAAAIGSGRIPGAVLSTFLELERSRR